MIDYRKMLKAYMTEVGESEGIYFIDHNTRQFYDLSEEEVKELMAIMYECGYFVDGVQKFED